jgi:hypothetical protein
MEETNLKVKCTELLEMAEDNPNEMEVIVDMLIEAEEELCGEQTA